MVHAIFRLIGKGAMRPAQVDVATNFQILKYGPIVRALGFVFAIIVPAAISLLAVVKPPTHRGETIALWVLFLSFFGLGAVLLLEALFTRVRITHLGIDAFSVWRWSRRIDWADIHSVRFSNVNNWFIVASHTGTKIRVHLWLTGISAFVAAMRANVPGAKAAGATEAFRFVDEGKINPRDRQKVNTRIE